MNMKRRVLVLCAIYMAVVFVSCPVFALGQPIEVNAQYDGTYLLVPVVVGNRNLMFVLDTAAGGSEISPATRDAIGLTEKDGQISDIVGAGGSTQYQSLKIPKISFGGHTRKDFNVTVIDLKKFQKKDGGEAYAGILGNDFLRNFDVEINLAASKLHLYPHGGKPKLINPKLNKKTDLPNRAQSEGFIEFEVLIQGKPVNTILDTGASSSILNWQAAREANVTPETNGIKKRERGTGGLGSQTAETFLYTFKSIRAGNTQFAEGKLRIADLFIFKALGMNEKPAMIFGLDMLKNHVVFISYSTKQIYFY